MFRLSVIALAAVALLPNALAATIKFNTDVRSTLFLLRLKTTRAMVWTRIR